MMKKEKRKKQEVIINNLKNGNNNYNKKNNNNSKKNNKMNLDKTYSKTNIICKDYKLSKNQSLRNYLHEINAHNKIINDNINSKNKFIKNAVINTENQENHNRFSVLMDI
jgi:transcription elongation factor Elf1